METRGDKLGNRFIRWTSIETASTKIEEDTTELRNVEAI